jgi:endonuclease-3
MQGTFDFGLGAGLTEARDRLAAFFGAPEPIPQRAPIDQLVKSLISNRTYDAVSLGAFDRLAGAYDGWAQVAAATDPRIEALIADVQFADRKAAHLGETLRRIGAERPDFDLGFLGGLPVSEAFIWLERLPGVGRKVAASVLNFSTLQRPALVIDTHVDRVLKKLGLVGARARIEVAYGAVMNAAADWSAADLTDLHVWMKRLGQTLCRPSGAHCDRCPLRDMCRAPRDLALG